MSAGNLLSIERFCPDGMQIKSPGGVWFDRDDIVGITAASGPPEPWLIIYLKCNSILVSFHRNVGGGPPDVYQLAENIRTGQTTRR